VSKYCKRETQQSDKLFKQNIYRVGAYLCEKLLIKISTIIRSKKYSFKQKKELLSLSDQPFLAYLSVLKKIVSDEQIEEVQRRVQQGKRFVSILAETEKTDEEWFLSMSDIILFDQEQIPFTLKNIGELFFEVTNDKLSNKLKDIKVLLKILIPDSDLFDYYPDNDMMKINFILVSEKIVRMLIKALAEKDFSNNHPDDTARYITIIKCCLNSSCTFLDKEIVENPHNDLRLRKMLYGKILHVFYEYLTFLKNQAVLQKVMEKLGWSMKQLGKSTSVFISNSLLLSLKELEVTADPESFQEELESIRKLSNFINSNHCKSKLDSEKTRIPEKHAYSWSVSL